MNKTEALALIRIKSRKLDADLKVETLLEALRRDGEFASAENERDGVGFQIAKLRYRNDDIGSLKDRYSLAEKRLRERLAELGHKPQDLVPAYSCKHCGDTGFENGKLCACVRREAYLMLKDNCKTLSTDIDDFAKISYDILPEAERGGYKKIAEALGKYSKQYATSKIKIIGLSGKQGTGKTYLMSVLANALMKSCALVVFYNAVQINDIFLKYHLAPVEEKEEIFAPLLETDFLVIDDLGAENYIKNVTETYLYELLVMREGKATGFTSNMNAEQIFEHYGHRIGSRLCSKENSFIVNFGGSDLRFARK